MLLRRLTASVLTLLILHLNVLGADFACVKHGSAEHGATKHVMTGHDVSDAAATEHAMDMSVAHTSPRHGGTHPEAATVVSDQNAVDDVSAPNVANENPPCDVPVQPNCCKALASCSVVFSAGSEFDTASVFQLAEQIAPGAMNAPPSERAAPEPPPPKA